MNDKNGWVGIAESGAEDIEVVGGFIGDGFDGI